MIFKSKRKSFEDCLKPLLPDLYRMAYRLCGSRADAEDLVQDMVVKVYKSPIDISSLENPKFWLNKVLYRLFVDDYRKNNRSPIINIIPDDKDSSTELENEAEDSEVNPELELEQRQFLQVIDNALKEIGEEYRVLVIMYEIEGYTLEEIQQILDVPVGTLKSRLHRARKKLRNFIEAGTKWRVTACSKLGNEK